MLNSIIRFSVRNKLIIGLLTLALVIWGILELRKLPIDALPDITSNQVQIITISPSLAAPEVERLITFPLEQANANIPGIREMRSISRFGLSVVTIVFDDAIDIYFARQQVSERLNSVRQQIPNSAGQPELAPVTTGIGEIYQYVIRPKPGYEGKYDLAELRSIQDWIVRRQLLGTPGVADVSSFGGYLKQYEIAVNPTHLKSMNLTVADVFTALEKNNANSGGAYIEKGPAALFIRTEGLAKSIADIESIIVRQTSTGIPVFIRDVATVRIGHAIRYGAMTYKDQGEVAGAVVLMLKGENASEVVRNVKARINEIRTTLPEGVVLEPFYDRTKMVDNAIRTVKTNLLEGALIVIFVLVLFLGNLRAGLIVASVIPLSMMFAIIMMNIFNVSGNLMSLGALDFGLIVDGAVIIVEAVLHGLALNAAYKGVSEISRQQMNAEVEINAGKMMNAAVFGQIIILIVYLPILSLTGIEGKMFRPMAQTVAFALIGAFLLSLTYVPMMSSLVLSRKLRHKPTFSDRAMNRIQIAYHRLLHKALAFPKLILTISLGLFVIALLIMTRLGGEFIPELEEGDFAVDARLVTGSSLTETIQSTQQAVHLLQSQFPEVEKIVTRIGASEIPTDPMPMEMTDIMITLRPKSTWTSASSFDELATKMSAVIDEIPGLTAGFQFPVQMRFNELISGARQDVVCKIFGEDLDTLAAVAARVGHVIGTVDGATDLYLEAVTGLPQIVINYNRQAMAVYQLTIDDINLLIRTAFAGEPAGIIYENERRFDLVLRLEDKSRSGIEDVRNMLIPTPAGAQIPLYQVAEVEIREGPNQIQREDAKRRIIAGFNVRGRDVESVVEELRAKVGQQVSMPSGYYIQYGGQFENLQEAKQRLSVAVPAALVLIFIMLYFAFGSVKYGLLIFTAIPLSTIGGIIALWLRDMPFSISAGVGFIALFGVAVLNGIVLIAEFNRLKKGGLTNINQLIMEGTAARLRPVLMTASVASLGFLPMALSQGSGAEVQRPLATVVIGGLVTATFLTLIVLPILYRWIENRSNKNLTKAALPMLLMLLLPIAGFSQQKMTLAEMINQAQRQNLELQTERLQSTYWKQLQQGVFDAPKTEIGGEYGGISSPHRDTRVFLQQQFNMPSVYRKQQAGFKSRELLQNQQVNWKQSLLEREVKRIFYQMTDILERKQLLYQLDTIFRKFSASADLRLRSGESNILEKTTADMQLLQVQLQHTQADADLRILQQQLKILLNTDVELLPEYSSVKLEPTIRMDTSFEDHPELLVREMETEVARAETEIARSKLSPDVTLGYSNQSIIGYYSMDGINQKYFSGTDRFHVVNLTLGIPLFNRGIKSRIRAAGVAEDISRLNTSITRQRLSNQYNQLLAEFRKAADMVAYFEKAGIPQANLIIRSANLSYENGEINYIEWSQLMNNAVAIRSAYLDALAAYNQALINLEYYNQKN